MRACLGFLLVSTTLATNAQELRFQHLTTDDGLSDNAITCLFEDRAGYLWIGTERGLNRYDGQRVDHFPPGATGPLGAHITSIAEDSRDRIWITTSDGGLSMRDPSGRFTHFQHDASDPSSLPTEALNHVLVLDDSLLLISSRGCGVIWFHVRKGFIQRRGYNAPLVGPAGDTIARAEENWCHRAMMLDDGRVFLPMMRSQGPYIADPRSGVLDTELISSPLITTAVEVDGALYMGGWTPGLFHAGLLDPGEPVRFPIDEEINTIVEWDSLHLLAATKVGGLLLLDRDGTIVKRFQHERTDPSSLGSDRTSCLLRDRSKNVWVGTAKGISVYAPSVWRFNAVPLLPDQRDGDLVFHAIQQDKNGTVRVSTSKGFVLVDPVSLSSRLVELAHAGAPLEVTGLFNTAPNEWFVGSETGIFRYDPNDERILRRNGAGRWESHRANFMYQSRALLAAKVGGRDLLISGALGYGHEAIDHTKGEKLEAWSGPPNEAGTLMIRSTMKDRSGSFWTATLGGVVRWRPAEPGTPSNGTVFSTRSGPGQRLPGNDAQSITCNGDTIWVALRDAGLASIVGERASAHVPPAHMPHDALGVTVDRSGNIWCTTSNGLLRYSPKEVSWLHVPVNDGRDFRQLTKCMITLKDGRIALCADDHLLLFDPSAFNVLPDPPTPMLAGLGNTWGELQANADGALELPYRNSAFDAMLTALQPIGAMPMTFLYRLDSEGDAAHEVHADVPARYAGVPAGSHKLLVRVRDAYGREGPEVTVLAVQVTGPFWQRWWFFALLLAVGALIMYLYSRLRHRQRLRLQGVRDRIARDLHDDIGSTLGSISFYSEALKRKLGNDSDGMTREVAQKIGTSSREMIDRMSDIVWSVDPKNDDASALLERLQAFSKDLLSAKDIALAYHDDGSLRARKVTAEQRRNLFLICKEALYNTVKYSGARKVMMALTGEERGITIEITDDGRGFDPERTDSYNGNGLVNMRTRAAAINAQLAIESAPGRGTRIKLHLPAQQLVPRSGD